MKPVEIISALYGVDERSLFASFTNYRPGYTYINEKLQYSVAE